MQDVWKSIALVAHDPVLSQHAAFVTYEKMWSYTGDIVTQLVRFVYGDVRCNASANKLARGFLAYTAGFRMYTAAGEVARNKGEEFDPQSVRSPVCFDLTRSLTQLLRTSVCFGRLCFGRACLTTDGWCAVFCQTLR